MPLRRLPRGTIGTADIFRPIGLPEVQAAHGAPPTRQARKRAHQRNPPSAQSAAAPKSPEFTADSPSALAAPMAPKPLTLVFADDIIESIAELRPAVGPIFDSLNTDVLPAAALSERSAEIVLAKHMGESRPCASVAERAKLESGMHRLNVAIEASVGEGDADLIATLRAKLSAEEVLLSKHI